MSSTLWIHIYLQSFMYLSPSEWYHRVRANWTLILWEYKYHVKESDPGLLRIYTLPTDKGINSPLMDQSSWIYDLKMSFNMKLGSQVFPSETACWVLTWWRKSEPTSALLFLFAFYFHPSLLSLSIKPSITYGVRHVSHLFFEVGLWCDNISHNRYCELTGWASNHRWLWSKVKRSIRLSTFTSPRPCIEIITPLCLSFSWWTVPIYHLDYLWTLITSSNNESEIHR